MKLLEQIILSIRKIGFVDSQRGGFGGYRLARSTKKIAIGQIVRLIDGPLAPIPRVSQNTYKKCSCPDEAPRGLRMLDVRTAIANILDRYTLVGVVEVTLRKMRRDGVPPPFSQPHCPAPLAAIPAAQPHPRLQSVAGFLLGLLLSDYGRILRQVLNSHPLTLVLPN